MDQVDLVWLTLTRANFLSLSYAYIPMNKILANEKGCHFYNAFFIG